MQPIIDRAAGWLAEPWVGKEKKLLAQLDEPEGEKFALACIVAFDVKGPFVQTDKARLEFAELYSESKVEPPLLAYARKFSRASLGKALVAIAFDSKFSPKTKVMALGCLMMPACR